jgi:hypothetical protein
MKKADRRVHNNKLQTEKEMKIVDVSVTFWKQKKKYENQEV